MSKTAQNTVGATVGAPVDQFKEEVAEETVEVTLPDTPSSLDPMGKVDLLLQLLEANMIKVRGKTFDGGQVSRCDLSWRVLEALSSMMEFPEMHGWRDRLRELSRLELAVSAVDSSCDFERRAARMTDRWLNTGRYPQQSLLKAVDDQIRRPEWQHRSGGGRGHKHRVHQGNIDQTTKKGGFFIQGNPQPFALCIIPDS